MAPSDESLARAVILASYCATASQPFGEHSASARSAASASARLTPSPLNGDINGRYVPDAKAAVWRTRDGGSGWQALRHGLPQENAYFGVLRQAMAADRLQPAGLYAGTNTGTLFASPDEGENWATIGQHLPPIHSVETLVLDG